MKAKKIAEVLNYVRSIPCIIAYFFSKQKKLISMDIDRWVDIQEVRYLGYSKVQYLNLLLLHTPEFRNLFYKRLDNWLITKILGVLLPKINSLYVHTRNIGGGLFISHGFSTIIVAKSIGENCWVNQQVTVGYGNDAIPPTIGNNVRIGAGAVVVGNIMIGDNSFIGAGAVVAKDVPENCVIIGNPAIILKRDGKVIKQTL